MNEIKFQDKNERFTIHNPENYCGLYLPIAGEGGLKSSITPNLRGDSKIDQNHFLLEPVSVENLHDNRSSRNFWVRIEGKGYWSACGNSAEQEYQKFSTLQDDSVLEAGFMWQTVKRISKKYELEATITSFVTLEDNVEVMLVQIQNRANYTQTLVPISSIPIYGRSADNLRDHRHVTSLLHRIQTTEYGVVTTPVLSFDERGHQKNNTSYYVCASMGDGEKPEQFYPTVSMFLGEGGSFLMPEAVQRETPGCRAGRNFEGKEAVGAIRFKSIQLQPNGIVNYIVLNGIANQLELIPDQIVKYQTKELVDYALEQVKEYWARKVNISFEMDNRCTDNYLKWISFQPILRRIYGCSFLPYHDYGKGGRGWRDLWQDCLALLLMEPAKVRQMIVDNYGGVRIDGTNATIIGSKQGEFIADRNNIARVWMDHAFWPFVTTKLYIDQTGDIDILLEKVPYFKDKQAMRGSQQDELWNEKDGNQQKTKDETTYYGSVLEHILLENLCAFYDVGEHNEIRLHGADWNDALDMAEERGESVAFSSAFAGNLLNIAEYLKRLEEHVGIKRIELADEMVSLFMLECEKYEDIHAKQEVLKQYTTLSKHTITGKKSVLDIQTVRVNLEEKAIWMMENIRKNEWIEDEDGNGWFNGYYDNHGLQVEGVRDGNVRMMLTSQVFSTMSGTATDTHIEKICKSADKYLYEKNAGGYRLNTDFHEEKYDLGRMFGFAYGEKENGAVFSHMTVMYANALYKRGYVKEGYKALQTLLEAAMDFEHSKMYPGLPEYFDNEGRGLYPYLTGAASWYLLTMVTEVFGVYGDMGNIIMEPKLMAEQFDENGIVRVRLCVNERQLCICYHNPNKKTYGEYEIETATYHDKTLTPLDSHKVQLNKEVLSRMEVTQEHQIDIYLI